MLVADTVRELDPVKVLQNLDRERPPDSGAIAQPGRGNGPAIFGGNFLGEGRMAEQSGRRKKTILRDAHKQTQARYANEKRLSLLRL